MTNESASDARPKGTTKRTKQRPFTERPAVLEPGARIGAWTTVSIDRLTKRAVCLCASSRRLATESTSPSCKNGDVAATSPTKLARPSEFTISRRSEFASRPELTKQIGHPPQDWPVAALKELGDNALDDAERAGVAPVIAITLDEEKETLTFPQPVKLGPRITAWRVEDIRDLIERLGR